MNWLQYVLKALSLVPYVVHGIETIHGDAKSGAEKKQLAMESLGLATEVASAADPEHQAAIDAATSLVSTAIDGTVAVMNAAKGTTTPVPVATNVPSAIIEAGQASTGGHPSNPAQSTITGQS